MLCEKCKTEIMIERQPYNAARDPDRRRGGRLRNFDQATLAEMFGANTNIMMLRCDVFNELWRRHDDELRRQQNEENGLFIDESGHMYVAFHPFGRRGSAEDDMIIAHRARRGVQAFITITKMREHSTDEDNDQ